MVVFKKRERCDQKYECWKMWYFQWCWKFASEPDWPSHHNETLTRENSGEKREPLNLASNPGAMLIPGNLARLKSWAYSIRASHFMSRARDWERSLPAHKNTAFSTESSNYITKSQQQKALAPRVSKAKTTLSTLTNQWWQRAWHDIHDS